MSEWKEYKLGEVLKFGNGKTRPKPEGEFPVYGGNGILGYTDQTNYDGETIIIGRVGAYCGSVFYENRPIWISDNALSAKSKGNNNTKFLFYFLKNLELNQFAEGSSHPLVTQTLLNSIDVEICLNKDEQKAIASVLCSLDDKIDLLHRQNETLEAMAETLFKKWFVEEVRDDWEEKVITDLFEIRDGTHDSPKQKDAGKPLLTSKHILNNRLDIENAYLIANEDFENVNRRSKVETNDILFSMIGTIGLVYLEQSTEINYCIKNIGLFKTSQNSKWSYYTYLWLKSSMGQEFIHENRSGSTQEYISLGSLRGIVFSVPHIEVIEEFNVTVKPLFDRLKNNSDQIRTLEKLRDALLPKLMSGEVRVEYGEIRGCDEWKS